MIPNRSQSVQVLAVLVSNCVTISKLSPSLGSHYYQVVVSFHCAFQHLPNPDLSYLPHGALLHQDFSTILDTLNFTPPTDQSLLINPL